MVIKLYDNTNTEFWNMQVVPNYVKYYLKYDQENIEEINKAYRDENTNELFLEIIYRYTQEEKLIFENPNYYPEGGYRGSKYEDFTNLPNGSDII